MDSYEAFVDEYIEFMKTYENSTDLSGLTKYSEYMTKYTDFVTKAMEYGNDDELSNEDLLYYTEVMGRIEKKLLDAGV